MSNQVVQLIDNNNNNIYPVAGALKDGSVTTSTINDGAVTASKIDFSTLGVNYSTSEVKTGAKWIDGSDVYRKVIVKTGIVSSDGNAIAHGISNLGTIVSMNGYLYNSAGSQYFALPRLQTQGLQYCVEPMITPTEVYFHTGSDANFDKGVMILEYTKSSQ